MPHLPASKPIFVGSCAAAGHTAAEPGATASVSWLQVGALGLLRAYKLTFSRLFPGSCRFLPTCSDYAADAIRSRGLLVGLALAAWRLARCQPFASAGYDPVPPARSSRRPA